jgi:hypothetical protein
LDIIKEINYGITLLKNFALATLHTLVSSFILAMTMGEGDKTFWKT